MPFSDQSVHIVDCCRTPIVTPFKGFRYKNCVQLGAAVLKSVVRRGQIKKDRIDEIILGNTVSAGAGQNVARQAACLAGLPQRIPAYAVNFVCGSGLQAVVLGARTIQCGEGRVMIAGGMESATHTPYLVSKTGKDQASAQEPLDSLIHDGLWCSITGKHMGQLCEDLAEEHHISRQAQDDYAFESFRKAQSAQETGAFNREIVPVRTSSIREAVLDDRLLKKKSRDAFDAFPAVFRKNGTITAANASAPADGAVAVLLASGKVVREDKLKTQARIVGSMAVAVDPARTFTSAIHAAKECLVKCRMNMDDIDLFEIGESFSAQAILTRDKLGIPEGKMNVYGGDVALGHPLGSSGARMLTTLVHALYQEKKKRGLVAVCLGGGGAVAMIVEAG